MKTSFSSYSLFAECTPPTPKGPIFVKSTGPTIITFTNPFLDPHTFIYNTDRFFTVKNSSELLKSKKNAKIIVGLQPQGKSCEYPLTGKLTITCQEEERKNVVWVYYLQSDQ